RAAVIRLRSSGRLREARRAWRQSHTLPPRTGGTAAALSGAPSASVLVLTHTGFSPDGRARAWWRLPMNRRLLIRTVLVPAAQLPPPDQLSPWLQQTWSIVDAWVADHADAESVVQEQPKPRSMPWLSSQVHSSRLRGAVSLRQTTRSVAGTQNIVCYFGRMDRFIVPAAA